MSIWSAWDGVAGSSRGQLQDGDRKTLWIVNFMAVSQCHCLDMNMGQDDCMAVVLEQRTRFTAVVVATFCRPCLRCRAGRLQRAGLLVGITRVVMSAWTIGPVYFPGFGHSYVILASDFRLCDFTGNSKSMMRLEEATTDTKQTPHSNIVVSSRYTQRRRCSPL